MKLVSYDTPEFLAEKAEHVIANGHTGFTCQDARAAVLHPPLTHYLRMLPPPAIPPLPSIRDDEWLPGPEVVVGGICSANRDRADSTTQSFGSIPTIAVPESNVLLERPIQLPVELWEKIIDHVADDWKYAYPNGSRTYEVQLRELGRVSGMAFPMQLSCTGDALCEEEGQDGQDAYVFADQRIFIGNFGSFAACMACKLPRVELLRFWHCSWVAEQLHTQVFLHITLAFGSVTTLDLDHVEFPSAVVFRRLLRALPLLSSLTCYQVRFKKECDAAGTARAPYSLRFDTVDLFYSDDVMDFLPLAGVHIHRLSGAEGYSGESWTRLLVALAESLSSLRIRLLYHVPNAYFPVANPFDFTPAVNLRVISFDLELKNLARVASTFSRTSLANLIEVRLVFSDYNPKSSLVEDALDKIDNDCYALVDQILLGRQYPALQKVVFHLDFYNIPHSKVMEVISESSWKSQLSSKLPALHSSGRLV
ncbi:uncharacterized protein FIBRA_08819 [Fibroporia radiculosa]|uniref:Uncharacterized protein n=1 Tax=Fibroporia radiculosa TaxID=599839 RepID=J4GXG7_9APHY|nr:uncharacterized protein FIBRA_08819 [Fibroporia radiculosa]CCM06545.1 predicted protein [Fibroporia radiculosa]